MRCRRTSRCGATSFWTERPIEQSACRLATCPTAQLLHELADGATHREKLRAIHATYDVADDRSEYPFDSSNAEAGRLLGEKARLGELQRPLRPSHLPLCPIPSKMRTCRITTSTCSSRSTTPQPPRWVTMASLRGICA